MSVHVFPSATLTAPAPVPTSVPTNRWLATLLLDTVVDLHDAGLVDDGTVLAHQVAALELALDVRLDSLRPQTHGYKTPADIGKALGLSPQRVGRVISALGLRRCAPGLAARVVTKTAHSWYLGWVYSPDAVARIRQHAVQSGAIAA